MTVDRRIARHLWNVWNWKLNGGAGAYLEHGNGRRWRNQDLLWEVLILPQEEQVNFMETLWTFPKARNFKVRPLAREVGEKLIWSLDNVDAPPKKWTDDIFTAVDLFQCHEVTSLKCLSWLWSGCHRMNCTKNEPRSIFPSLLVYLLPKSKIDYDSPTIFFLHTREVQGPWDIVPPDFWPKGLYRYHIIPFAF